MHDIGANYREASCWHEEALRSMLVTPLREADETLYGLELPAKSAPVARH